MISASSSFFGHRDITHSSGSLKQQQKRIVFTFSLERFTTSGLSACVTYLEAAQVYHTQATPLCVLC